LSFSPAPIDCRRCRFYFVTWDENFPHGCRRMGFKSRLSPNDEVRKAMRGAACRFYAKKEPRAGLAAGCNGGG
jgi:hypothetical protein